jgi:hypothetical protein
MTAASTVENMSPELLKVTERAKRDPKMRFFSLAHLIDEEALERAYRRIRKDAAVGVDGITKEQYGLELRRNVANLHSRMKAMRYRLIPSIRGAAPRLPTALAFGQTHAFFFSIFQREIQSRDRSNACRCVGSAEWVGSGARCPCAVPQSWPE